MTLAALLILILLLPSADRVENVFQICHVSPGRSGCRKHLFTLLPSSPSLPESWNLARCRPFLGLFSTFSHPDRSTTSFKELPAAHYGSRRAGVNLAALLEVMKSSCLPLPRRSAIPSNLASEVESFTRDIFKRGW